MVLLTQRQQEILHAIMTATNGIGSHDLEKLTDISRRTLYRELADLKFFLQNQGLSLENKHRHYQITGDPTSLTQLQAQLQSTTKPTITSSQRHNAIGAILLQRDEPLKIASIALELQISEGSVQRTLDEVEKQLANYELTLIRKKGYGIQVQGDESQKRLLLCGILLSEINEYTFMKYLDSNQTTSDNFFLSLLDKNLLLLCRHALKPILDSVALNSDQQMIQLIILFSLAISCGGRGHHLKAQPADNHVLAYQAKVAEIVKTLPAKYQANITFQDIIFLAQQIQATDYIPLQFSLDRDQSFTITVQVQSFIREVSERFGRDFQNSPSFLRRLTKHIFNISQKNIQQLPNANIETLTALETDYPKLFSAIQFAWQKHFGQIQLSQPEFQLLLLYFANEFQRLNQNSLSALVICENGISASAMLISQLEKEFGEFKKITPLRVSNLATTNLDEYDIILSTLKLPGFKHEYLLVSPLITRQERQMIRSALAELQPQKKAEITPIVQHTAFELLAKETNFFDRAKDLLALTSLSQLNNQDLDLKASIALISQQIPTLITTQVDEIGQALFKRSQLAPIALPNSRIALLHTSNPHIRHCYFSIFDLKEPLTMITMDQESTQVSRFLLMLGPTDMDENQSKLMSLISSNIILNQDNLRLFEQGNLHEIQDNLAQRFIEYSQKIIKDHQS
ncbi:BglG family transcription antiterminator [Ligilactobacillus equi]